MEEGIMKVEKTETGMGMSLISSVSEFVVTFHPLASGF
jgi:hypothetical protein